MRLKINYILSYILSYLNRASSNFDFYVKFYLDGQSLTKIIGILIKVCQCHLPPKTTEILTKIFCTSGPNLVMVAWTGNELCCKQARGWCTHRHMDTHMDAHMDGQTQATTIPEGHNWPWVKIIVQWQESKAEQTCVCILWNTQQLQISWSDQLENMAMMKRQKCPIPGGWFNIKVPFYQ